MRFSLKLKVLAVLFVLPLGALVTFLVVSVPTLTRDRMSFEYESSLTQAQLLAEKVSGRARPVLREIDERLLKATPMSALGEEEIRQFRVSEGMLAREISHLALWRWVPRARAPSRVWSESGFPEMEAKHYLSLRSVLQMKRPLRRYVSFLPDPDPKFWQLVILQPPTAPKSPAYFLVARIPVNLLLDLRQLNMVGTALWLSQLGPTLKMTERVSDPVLTGLGQEILGRQRFDGAFRLDSQGGNQLVAFSFARGLGLFLVYIQPEIFATEGVYVLIEKILILFAAVLAAVLVFAVVVSRRMTGDLSQLVAATASIGEGKFDLDLKVSSRDEVGDLASKMQSMAKKIKSLITETKELARIESEFKTAQLVQENFLPPLGTKCTVGQIVSYNRQASETGGDWYRFRETEQYYYIFIGDATGHGVPAALVTAAVHSSACLLEAQDESDLSRIASLMNKAILQTVHSRLGMTVHFFRLDKTTGMVRYLNASHEAPIVLRKVTEKSKPGDLEYLMGEGGSPMGTEDDKPYVDSEFKLEPGDVVAFYTDGVTELKSPEEKNWGDTKFSRSLIKAVARSKDLAQVRDQVLAEMEQHRQGFPLADDVTMVLFRYQP